MNDRIHRHLDGDLPSSSLTEEERAEAIRYQESVRAVVDPLQTIEPPDLTAGVLARIARYKEPKRSVWRTVLAWWWSPRAVSFRLRPAVALAAVAFITVFSVNSIDGGPPAEPAAPQLFVQFRLDAPAAQTVALAGDFTGWQPDLQLRRSAAGVWTILVPLEPGVHDYAFVIDGNRWMADPAAPRVDDGFGGSNSRMSLLRPGPAKSS